MCHQKIDYSNAWNRTKGILYETSLLLKSKTETTLLTLPITFYTKAKPINYSWQNFAFVIGVFSVSLSGSPSTDNNR